MINYWQILTTNFADKNWSIEGNSYEGIAWSDQTPKPTQSELDALWESTQATVTATQYQRNRAAEYPTMQEQLDMQYWDSINGTTTWQDAINAIKAKYPKPE